MSTILLRHTSRKNAVLLLAGLLTLYVFVPRLSSFKSSFATVHDADFAYVGLGLLFWVATLLAAAAVYAFIALRPISYRRTALIQLAGGFTNRLAPAGTGGIALNVRYLVKRGHSAIEASALVAVNNFLGFIGNVILLVFALALSQTPLSSLLKINLHLSVALIIVIGIFTTAAFIFLVFAGSKTIVKFKKAIGLMARHVIGRPGRLTAALVASMAITASYALVLYSVGLAFNVHLTVVQTLLVLTFGVAAATITPTPGGLGGAEAGLVAALLSMGVSSHQALTVALTYRFLVYWLPLLPGLLSFEYVLHRRYI